MLTTTTTPTDTTLHTIKPGEYLAVTSYSGNTTRRVAVARVTSTQVVVGDAAVGSEQRFRKSDGGEVGTTRGQYARPWTAGDDAHEADRKVRNELAVQFAALTKRVDAAVRYSDGDAVALLAAINAALAVPRAGGVAGA